METHLPIETIQRSIYVVRGQKVMLDSELAILYGVETKTLVRAVKRNQDRFPDDFMFQLQDQEWENLRYQIGTSSSWGGRRFAPYVFTEQGVAMLSSVLQSSHAVQVNIQIMRAFVAIRQILQDGPRTGGSHWWRWRELNPRPRSVTWRVVTGLVRIA